MRRVRARLASSGLVASLVAGSLMALGTSAAGAVPVGSYSGTSEAGAQWAIQVPEDWNGTLLVYSGGYGGLRPPDLLAGRDGDSPLKRALLDRGYALAGSGFSGGDWAIEQAIDDQVAVVRRFEAMAESPDQLPTNVIAWGNSMGGAISAGLAEKHPHVFDGALPVCGSIAGPIGMLDAGLDAAYVFERLLAPGLQLVDFGPGEENARNTTSRAVLAEAEDSAEGRARLALASAMAQLPNGLPAPVTDATSEEWEAQAAVQRSVFQFGIFSPRTPLEARAGGNFSTNVDIDYEAQLDLSGYRPLVEAMYEAAGLDADDLEADLDVLADGPRIEAEPGARRYMERYFTTNGDVRVPVLTLQNTGDSAPQITQSSAYSTAVQRAGNDENLRQTLVQASGHCGASSAERLAAVETLVERLDTGEWPDTGPDAMQARAEALTEEHELDGREPAFVDHDLPDFVRTHRYAEENVVVTGELADGTPLRMTRPPVWNGTVIVNIDGSPQSAWLLQHGYALIQTSRMPANWHIERHADNSIEALGRFEDEFGTPEYTVALGSSRGASAARGVIQHHPGSIDAGLAMCGAGAGAIAMWNSKLDLAFAAVELIDPNRDIELVDITDAAAAQAAVGALVSDARGTEEGRARLTLAATFAHVPEWTSGAEPAPDDLDTIQDQMIDSIAFAVAPQFRYQIEQLAGGNYSWNHGVDYTATLDESGHRDLIEAIYDEAGLDLEADLQTLADAPRIAADVDAVSFVELDGTYEGDLIQPVFSLHTTGDAAGPPSDESAYRDTVEAAGRGELLRNAFVRRAGHCSFRGAEQLASFTVLIERMRSAEWFDTDPAALTRIGEDLDAVWSSDLGSSTTSFSEVDPPMHPRPWDARSWGTYVVPEDDDVEDEEPIEPEEPGFLECPASSGSGFPDVASTSEHAAATACGDALGLLLGARDGSFRPSAPLTRGQAATVIDRIASATGRPIAGEVRTFGDVPARYAHAEAIGRLAGAEVIRGFEDGTFRPEAPVTRGQLASLLVRYIEGVNGGPLPLGEPFPDVQPGTELADTLRKARSIGVFRGTARGDAAPARDIRRDQAASLFVRSLEVVPLAR